MLMRPPLFRKFLGNFDEEIGNDSDPDRGISENRIWELAVAQGEGLKRGLRVTVIDGEVTLGGEVREELDRGGSELLICKCDGAEGKRRMRREAGVAHLVIHFDGYYLL